MSTVQVATPEHDMSERAELIHALREFSIEDELVLPRLFALATVRKVDTEDIKNFTVTFEDEVSDTTFIGGWVALESSLDGVDVLAHMFSNPDSGSSISWLLCRIVECLISVGIIEEESELIRTTLDFLHEEDIRLVGRDELVEFSLFLDCADAIDVPGDDFHSVKFREITWCLSF